MRERDEVEEGEEQVEEEEEEEAGDLYGRITEATKRTHSAIRSQLKL